MDAIKQDGVSENGGMTTLEEYRRDRDAESQAEGTSLEVELTITTAMNEAAVEDGPYQQPWKEVNCQY